MTAAIVRPFQKLLFLLIPAALVSCAWVEPTSEGSAINLLQLSEATQCTRIGTTTSSIKDRIGWFNRSEDKVADELLTLARNAAAEMGGDSLTANSEPTEGNQQFVVYNCP